MPSPTEWPTGWGSSHQDQPKRREPFRIWMAIWLAVWMFEWQTIVGAIVILGSAWVAWFVARVMAIRWGELDLPATKVTEAPKPLQAVLEQARVNGGGIYLGSDETGQWRFAPAQRAALILGPPRSGKTTGVIVPALLTHAGPAVSTSTKPDVLRATFGARLRLGEVWRFDPTGVASDSPGRELRWSPVSSCGVWDDALLMARAMVLGAGVGHGTSDASHWSKRAQALLACLLHAAVAGGRDITGVLEWVMGHQLDEPGMLLERHHGAPQAISLLKGLANTEGRERSSIFSAAADALDAYSSYGALDAAREPNFDPGQFARSRGTVYIHAPAEHQSVVAPLVCGLLSEIRRETYAAFNEHALAARVLFALDEVANIAPLAELGQIASEGGSQGLALLAVLQDLSQARQRWGIIADGFLTLFQSKLILPGIADGQTLEQLSLALGEYDRRMVSSTGSGGFGSAVGAMIAGRSAAPAGNTTITTQRTRVLSPGEIAGIPAGHALHLEGVGWELLRLTQSYRDEPWRTLTQLRQGR